MAITEFTPTDKSGWIVRNSLGAYTVYTGVFTTQLTCGWNDKGGRSELQKRMYLNFDTDGGIPANAVVTKVEVYTDTYALATSGTNPGNWINQFLMGTFIGAALDSTDWSLGSSVLYEDWTTPTNPTSEYVDLTNNAPQYYNNSGDTDIAIRDTSDYTAGQGDWTWTGRKTKMKMRVHWHIPQVIKMM